MFVSFFPKPKLFFLSAIGWTILAIALWYGLAGDAGPWFGLPDPAMGEAPVVGVSIFWSPSFLWFYIYYTVMVGLFAAFWMV